MFFNDSNEASPQKTIWKSIVRGVFPILFVGVCLGHASNSAVSAEDAQTRQESFKTFRGICHIHTRSSHDSNASLQDVIAILKKEDLDFGLITDHNSLDGVKKYERLKKKDTPLLIFASEYSTDSGHLIALGVSIMPEEELPSGELVNWIHEQGGAAILAHPFSPKEPWNNWDINDWDGFEVYNFGHELYDRDAVGFGLSLYSEEEADVLQEVQDLSDTSTEMWDAFTAERPVAAITGSNAHLRRSQQYFRVALNSSTQYVIARNKSEIEIVEALSKGHSYMVFESRGKALDFSFTASQEEISYRIGDVIEKTGEVVMEIHLPEAATIRVIQNGAIIGEEVSDHLEFSVDQRGTYRVEVYKQEGLWIFTNPMYII